MFKSIIMAFLYVCIVNCALASIIPLIKYFSRLNKQKKNKRNIELVEDKPEIIEQKSKIKFIKLENVFKKIKIDYFKLIIIILLSVCALQLVQINEILKEHNDYTESQLDKIESELEGFYSDWFRSN